MMEHWEALKDLREERFQKIRERQQKGASGEPIVASVTGLADEIIGRVYHQVTRSVPLPVRLKLQDNLAVISLGGYGRGELAPYSDIDLMFLHRSSVRKVVEKPVADFLQHLWDIGYQVGHSVRSIDDCTALAQQDLTIRTSLMEARFLEGGQRLFDRFRVRFNRKVGLRKPASFISRKVSIRREEYEQYGTTVYLLEPNIKMSKGGLRDIHLLQWAALSRSHAGTLESLKAQAILSSREHAVLTRAREFLWRIRNELHFSAGRGQDRLTFEEQVRIAKLWGFEDEEHLLGVERFMKQYYEKTADILEISQQILDQMATRSLRERILNYTQRRSIDSFYHVKGKEISVHSDERAGVVGDPTHWMKLFSLAQLYQLDLSRETQILLKTARESGTLSTEWQGGATELFLEILGRSNRVAKTLRELHRLKLLEIIIPEFFQTRGLMQFNEYHKYTIDEHCIRAVEEAESLGDSSTEVSRVYHEIRRKEVLHLALLIHDLGKGQGSDHSEIGVRIAQGLSERLGLDRKSTKILVFLVREHLIMTRIAFRRDLSDEKVILQFAKLVGTPEMLRMLYILTLADIAAVGPGTLTVWKQDLLAELFRNTFEALTGEKVIVAKSEKIKYAKQWIQSEWGETDSNWVGEQLNFMTDRFLLATPPDRILRHLHGVQELIASRVAVETEYDPVRQTTEYTVYTTSDLCEGIFYKIAGVLAARGLQILGASISTWMNGTIVDTFQVQDPDFIGAPSKRKLEKVSRAIREVLTDQVRVETLLSEGWRIQSLSKLHALGAPTQVEVDNTSSDRSSIIEVFAQDRQGLLFIIVRVLFELGLSVHTAKVSTQLDQIVDVFYVTDQNLEKVTDQDFIQRIRPRLLDEIEHFHEDSQGRPSFTSFRNKD